MADWEDIRTFLAVMRAGTLAAAGRRLGVDYTTVGRRVRALEEELGLTLFERVRDRYVLTEAAEGLREAAERMEEAALTLERRALGADRTVSGLLRVTTTDALARALVLPAIQALHERHPDIRVHLITSGARLDIGRREADVAVRYVRPDSGELVSRRVARVAATFYAAREYLARRPVPPRPTSLRGHDFVAPEEWMRTWSRPLPDARYVLRSNNMSNLVEAVARGIGIGALHCWLADPLPDLVRLWPDEPLEHDDVYLVLHHDVQRTGRVRAFVEALEQRAAEAAPLLEARATSAVKRRRMDE
ncbi:MAG TPA: LysR family transcriptional regulator [Myxococcaceae bacterium]|nr:LysR family transcriptional regulator [Myxococcaceae bacterium]